jgi:hypothetical protein
MMPDNSAKQIVLHALQSQPDFSGLHEIPALHGAQGSRLLGWLDLSGLALPLWRRIESQHQEAGRLPQEWRDALQERQNRNALRFRDMLAEFQRVNDAFRANSIDCITMKGFSLIPDFCGDPAIRHQTDFDFLVDPAGVEKTAAVLQSLGYSTPRLSSTEESPFTTPLRRVPSHKDDIYALQQHRQVDLHVSLTERSEWIDLRVPDDCHRRAVDLTSCGIRFRALSLADRFICQIFHAFRHSFRSWVRLSWLLEIGRFIEIHRENAVLWGKVIDLSGSDTVTQRIFGFILQLANRLFKSAIPRELHAWTEPGITKSMRAWLDFFSEKWGLADWPGNLSNLFLASEFIPDRRLRHQYWASRLFPKQAVGAIKSLRGPQSAKPMLGNVQQWIYAANRSRVHLKDLLGLPANILRWRLALR